MNAKELRQAAEYLVEQWDNHDKFRTVEGDEAFLNRYGEPDTVSMSRHILATVRDDDDESVTKGSWGEKIRFQSNTIAYWYDKWYGISKEKKRGQFRALCKGLGIELKEGN